VKAAYWDILKHSSIYGLGQILSRCASFLMLPFYTSYLRPAEYGCIAILDVTAAVLSIVVSAGMGAAVSRYHFEAPDEAGQKRVWWTGLAIIMLVASAVVVPAWLLRHPLARLTLGPSQLQGGYYYSLALLTVWVVAVGYLFEIYLRVRKWSGLYVVSSFLCLLLNIALNIYFLAVLHWGVAGLLCGNLIANAVRMAWLSVIFWWNNGRQAFDLDLAFRLLKFGVPLVATALLAVVMNQADRYLLRLFAGMDEVGVYSLAASIGQAINALCLMPFASIWGVVIYEIAEQQHAKTIYVQIFQYFVYCQMLVLFAISLLTKPILALMTKPDYAGAENLIPIVALAFLFFSLHEHFKVPALLAKHTLGLLPAYATAAVVNIGANVVLIPLLGSAGAAWVSVLTFAIFSFLGLWRYRLIDKYDYPLLRCGIALVGMIASYIAFRFLDCLGLSNAWLIGISALMWCGWASVLLGRSASQLVVLGLRRRQERLAKVACAESS
jgi:O-antigen/teichoic acid export membrane protein